MILKRSIEKIVLAACKISPIVFLKGARQVGKSTLAMQLFENYIVLDDVSTRVSAKNDPNLFIKKLNKPVCIDEIQKTPELLEAIKIYVDRNRKNGDFLLTGSANILNMKHTKDTLTGRIIEVELHTFSAKEKVNKAHENIIDSLFNKNFNISLKSHDEIANEIINGGYPEILNLKSPLERKLWFASYVSTYVERDARNMAELRDIDSFFRFLHILAPRTSTLLNKSDMAKEVGVRMETIENYLIILEQIFQIKLIRAYYENIGKQFVKSPKLYFNDTGVVSYLLGIFDKETLDASPYKGALFETFVCNELIKHISFTFAPTQIFHYRTKDQREIDFVLKQKEKLVAIEVKSSSRIERKDFKHILDFQKSSSKEVLGVIFYLGDNVLWISDKCVALPFGFFW